MNWQLKGSESEQALVVNDLSRLLIAVQAAQSGGSDGIQTRQTRSQEVKVRARIVVELRKSARRDSLFAK
jgi:hypothetical protein